MSFNTANNNTFVMAPTSPNPYISRKLNNMDQAQVMKRERRLDKVISQDTERNQNDNQYTENAKGYEENSGGNEYNSHRNGRDNPSGQYQQSDNEHDQYYSNSRRSTIFDTKQYE